MAAKAKEDNRKLYSKGGIFVSRDDEYIRNEAIVDVTNHLEGLKGWIETDIDFSDKGK